MTARCPLDDTLLRYAAGDLDDAVAADVDSHLGTCETCLSRIEEVSKNDALFSKLRGQREPAPTPVALDRVVSAVIHNLQIAGPPPVPARRVRDYVLLDEVGRGGMGQVYRAAHPRLNVEVAVKLLRPGLDGPSLRARFEAEREVLARMDHPNIAKVFDAGVSEDDRPFFVMEFLRGSTLTKCVADDGLDLRSRLGLFREVCHAIQHAHQKGIIHRDIKPSNVLVVRQDGRLVPKVIDFGVARAVDPGEPRHTEHGAVVGTLEYMSPEQTLDTAAGLDTRSDVFALGVLLYELLTGGTPTAALRDRDGRPRDVATLIREVDPPPPSAVATVPVPSRRVRDELDWIVLKALEKDPARRYESAAALADDVGRLLADEPVRAAPASRRYRLKKFLRRNRAAVVGSTLVFVALLAGVVGTTWQMVRALAAEGRAEDRATAARDAEKKAREESAKATAAEAGAVADRNRAVDAEADATAFNQFLVNYVLAASRPDLAGRGLGRTVTLAEALAVAEKNLDKAFAGRPAAEIRARIVLGQTWFQFRRFPDAERHYLRAMDLLAMQPVPDRDAVHECQSQLVAIYEHTSRYAAARKLAEECLPAFAAAHGPDDDRVVALGMELGLVLLHLGETANALPRLKAAMDARAKRFGPDEERTLTATNNYALGLQQAGRYDESLQLHQAVLKTRLARQGKDYQSTISSMNNVATLLALKKRPEQAVVLLEKALPWARDHLSEEHTTTQSILNNLGQCYKDTGRTADAIRVLEECRALRLKHLGLGNADTHITLSNLAAAYKAADRLDDAIRLNETVYRERLKLHGPAHADTRLTGNNLGSYLLLARRYEAAVAVLEPTAAAATAADGPDKFQTMATAYYLAQAYFQLNLPDAAEPWLKQSLACATGPAGAKTGIGKAVVELYAGLLAGRGEYAEAERLLRPLIPADGPVPKPTTITGGKALADLGQCLAARKQFAAAEPLLLAAFNYLRQAHARWHPAVTDATMAALVTRVADLYRDWGKPDQESAWRDRKPTRRELAPRPRAKGGA
jgi:hypothetical protein